MRRVITITIGAIGAIGALAVVSATLIVAVLFVAAVCAGARRSAEAVLISKAEDGYVPSPARRGQPQWRYVGPAKAKETIGR